MVAPHRLLQKSRGRQPSSDHAQETEPVRVSRGRLPPRGQASRDLFLQSVSCSPYVILGSPAEMELLTNSHPSSLLCCVSLWECCALPCFRLFIVTDNARRVQLARRSRDGVCSGHAPPASVTNRSQKIMGRKKHIMADPRPNPRSIGAMTSAQNCQNLLRTRHGPHTLASARALSPHQARLS